MAAFNPPSELHGFPLSERSRWLLYAPTWMLFPAWRKQVLAGPITDAFVKWDWLSRGVNRHNIQFRAKPAPQE